MSARAPARMDRPCLQQRADLPKRPSQVVVVLAVHRHVARVRAVEAHYHTHRRRLARAVGPKEARDYAGPDGEAQVVDREPVAVALGEVLGLDHAVVLVPAPGWSPIAVLDVRVVVMLGVQPMPSSVRAAGPCFDPPKNGFF